MCIKYSCHIPYIYIISYVNYFSVKLKKKFAVRKAIDFQF